MKEKTRLSVILFIAVSFAIMPISFGVSLFVFDPNSQPSRIAALIGALGAIPLVIGIYLLLQIHIQRAEAFMAWRNSHRILFWGGIMPFFIYIVSRVPIYLKKWGY